MQHSCATCRDGLTWFFDEFLPQQYTKEKAQSIDPENFMDFKSWGRKLFGCLTEKIVDTKPESTV